MSELNWTGERLVTSISNVYGVIEHLHRYALACEISKNKVVLDIASGEGYGSYLLSKKASYVYGVDIDEKSIIHAQNKYSGISNLKYCTGSASAIPLADESVDIVVSFETIEHHDKHDEMMKEVKRVLKKDGFLFISSPEKSIYKKRDPKNEFHIKELLLEEFQELLKKYFTKVDFFTQRISVGSVINSESQGYKKGFKFFNGSYTEIKEELTKDKFYNEPFFNIALCCNNENISYDIPGNSLFDGIDVLKNEQKSISNEVLLLKKTNRYRLGNWLIKKLQVIDKIIDRYKKHDN